MDPTEVVVAQPAGELRLGQRVSWVLPMTGRRTLVQCDEAGELLVVDQHLQPLWRLQVPAAAGWDGIHAVADDLSLAALSLEKHVLLLDGTGRQLARLPHQPTSPYDQGLCVFAGDGRHLWATVTWVSLTHEVPRRLGEGGDELWLIDLATRSLADRRRLDTGAAICPNIDAGAANELRRHRFVDDQPIEALPLSAGAALDQEVWWDEHAGYLTDELILAGTTEPERHVLVQRQPLRLLASVAYPGEDRPDWLGPCGDGSWLTVGADRVRRWLLLPDQPAQADHPQ